MGNKALAMLRAMTGLWLIVLVLPNLDRSFIEHLSGILDQLAQANPYPAYRWLMHNVAAPHLEQLGTLLSVGQLLVGSALVIGFLTRLASGLGIFYALNLFLAAGHLSFFHQSFSILLAMVFFTLWVGDAGMTYGADGFLFKPKADADPVNVKLKDKKQRKIVDKLNKELKKSASPNKKKKTKSPA